MQSTSTAEKSVRKPTPEIIVTDISKEEFRDVVFIPSCEVYTIRNPQKLHTRKDGKIHTVIDADGMYHQFADPSTGKTLVRWKLKPPVSPAS